MQFLVNARHWQIFIMLLIPIACIFIIGEIFTQLQIGFMWLLLITVELAWLYAIGSKANERVEADLQRNQQLFLLAPFLCVMLFATVLAVMYRSSEIQQPPPPWLIYLVFAGLGTFFYTLWYAASQLVTAEKQAKTFYIEYAFVMLGLWFGIVGAWFIQPRVNRTLSDATT